VRSDGQEIRHAPRDDFGPFLVLRNSKFPLTTLCSCFGNGIMPVVDVGIIGDGLPVLPGTASLFEMVSIPEASVSMSGALMGNI
jgi:hypothetical protein